ncbi:hypothetical protein AKG39_19110 [Acetobacterium bakii]|uniref:Uncharacterized protein n=1 Tax=Acetobacterium bakii TaxID=52689 RepID=A0A0L6TV74_9FIRM|nr:hypothetical protein AKG39_19110 [Acetobacterium bakii]
MHEQWYNRSKDIPSLSIVILQMIEIIRHNDRQKKRPGAVKKSKNQFDYLIKDKGLEIQNYKIYAPRN